MGQSGSVSECFKRRKTSNYLHRIEQAHATMLANRSGASSRRAILVGEIEDAQRKYADNPVLLCQEIKARTDELMSVNQLISMYDQQLNVARTKKAKFEALVRAGDFVKVDKLMSEALEFLNKGSDKVVETLADGAVATQQADQTLKEIDVAISISGKQPDALPGTAAASGARKQVSMDDVQELLASVGIAPKSTAADKAGPPATIATAAAATSEPTQPSLPIAAYASAVDRKAGDGPAATAPMIGNKPVPVSRPPAATVRRGVVLRYEAAS